MIVKILICCVPVFLVNCRHECESSYDSDENVSVKESTVEKESMTEDLQRKSDSKIVYYISGFSNEAIEEFVKNNHDKLELKQERGQSEKNN